MSLDFTLCATEKTGFLKYREKEVFWRNATHNLIPMWGAAGVYSALYDSQGKKAKTILVCLKRGVEHMADNPKLYHALEPPNGRGSYLVALFFLRTVYIACNTYPKAVISISK